MACPSPRRGRSRRPSPSFESAGLLTIAGLVQGTDGGEELTGTERDEVIDAGGGDDTITPRGGNDIITTGGGSDSGEPRSRATRTKGNDVITDFSVPSGLWIQWQGISSTLRWRMFSRRIQTCLPPMATPVLVARLISTRAKTGISGRPKAASLLLTHPNGSVEIAEHRVQRPDLRRSGPVIRVDG